MLVDGVAPLGDDAFPTFLTGTLPRFLIIECSDPSKRRTKGKRLQQHPPLVEWKRAHITPIHPQDVEHVIREAAWFVGLAR
jgi:hypothetical protein